MEENFTTTTEEIKKRFPSFQGKELENQTKTCQILRCLGFCIVLQKNQNPRVISFKEALRILKDDD